MSIFDNLDPETREQIAAARRTFKTEQRGNTRDKRRREEGRDAFNTKVASKAWGGLESSGLRSQTAMDMAAQVITEYPAAVPEPKGPNGERGKGKMAVATANAVQVLMALQAERHAENPDGTLTPIAWAARYEKSLEVGQAVAKRLLVDAYAAVQAEYDQRRQAAKANANA